MPSYTITDPDTGRKVTLTGESPPTEQELTEIFASLPKAENKPIQDISSKEPLKPNKIDESLGLNTPTGKAISEGAAAVNRGAIGLVDMLGAPIRLPINAGLSLAGSDYQIPTLRESLSSTPASVEGNFMQDGLGKNIIRAAGENLPSALAVGGAFRAGAAALPSMGTASESTAAGVLRQLGNSTAKQDAAFSGVSAVGQEAGREYGGEQGALAGAVGFPLTVAGGALALKGIINAGKKGIDSLFGVTKGLSDAGAATMLAEAMVREGLSPDEVAKKVASMGDDGMLADTGNNFARLLRVASNKIPRIEGLAAQQFGKRQSKQAERLSGALDDGTGTPLLTVDDEIARLENTMGPEITKLYSQAKESSFTPSARLKSLMEGDNAIGRAAKEAQKNLADYEAVGAPSTPMALVDETKKVIDAQISKAIRDGDKGTSSRLLQLKKVMVDEADTAAPDYAKARSMFAGKQQLKNAADLGGDFFKTNPRELKQLTETFGESERRMYKLGAKQAIMDRFDNINANADLIGRTFGKNGDAEKLRTLFDTKDQFEQFKGTLEREANWVLTRRAAQANSTTAKQLSDEDSAQEAFTAAKEALSSPMGAANALGKIIGGLGKKKGDAEFIRSLEQAGDILLESGMNPEAVRALLKKGSAPLIEKALQNQINRKSSLWAPIGVGTVNSQKENKQ